jgi:hypothetical protein
MVSDDEIRASARALLARIRKDSELTDAPAANDLLTRLRNIRDFPLLMDLAEAIGRVAPTEPTPRRLYAQALIETGRITVALDVLEVLRRRMPPDHSEMAEATGLLGRSYKQMYFDTRFRASETAKFAMSRAIDAYRAGYLANTTRNTWHGVNLLACAAHCRRNGIAYPQEVDGKKLANELLTTLHAMPETERDDWYLATLAEVSLGTEDWDTIETALQRYAVSPTTTAFHLSSTLRQFTQVWNIDQDERGAAALEVLKVRMMQLPAATLTVPANPLFQKVPSESQFQAVLGNIRGTQTRSWWIKALDQGLGVAAIRLKLAGRIGTGFLLRSKDLTANDPSEYLVLTNFHVVNSAGAEGGALPDAVEVRFEAVDANLSYDIDEILCESPRDDLDFCLMRLKGNLKDPKPLDIARALPVLELNPPQPQVYVIGHPKGNEQTYAFQDNEILDHEGLPGGAPPRPEICRVHYHTTTEEGNSGSPVFNSMWSVVALHHKGGKIMPKLNGKPGTYAANEGIWMQSIIAKVKSRV